MGIAVVSETTRCDVMKAAVGALCLLLWGCAAPYEVPSENLGKPIKRVTPVVTTIGGEGLDAADPSAAYVVKRGDTLFSIAWRFEQDPDVLRRRNQLDSDLIRPGQSLRLKGPIPEAPIEPAAVPPTLKATPEPAPSQAKPSKPVPPPAKKPIPREKPAPATAVPALAGWQWPVDGPVLEGYSTKTRFSRSLQLGGKPGTPVKAAAAGRVVYAGDGLVGFGNLVIISHEGKLLSAYGHNQSLAVRVGDVVQGGQVIAKMGSTGTDRVKLHFEIRKEGTPINPAGLLPKRG